MIEFPLKAIDTEHLGVIYRPIATVILKGPKNEVLAEMIVDSGADVSIIPFEVGSYLGFRIEKNEDIKSLGGISGGIPVVYRQAKIEIGDYDFLATVAWALTEDVPEILGRVGVFEEFDIEFKQKERRTIFCKS